VLRGRRMGRRRRSEIFRLRCRVVVVVGVLCHSSMIRRKCAMCNITNRFLSSAKVDGRWSSAPSPRRCHHRRVKLAQYEFISLTIGPSLGRHIYQPNLKRRNDRDILTSCSYTLSWAAHIGEHCTPDESGSPVYLMYDPFSLPHRAHRFSPVRMVSRKVCRR
jgi:hypothetical protein